MNDVMWYSIALFVVVLGAGCILNLLKQHYVFQLIGIAFFFTYFIIECCLLLQDKPHASLFELYYAVLPLLAGISACLISMASGFWIFPLVRKKIKA